MIVTIRELRAAKRRWASLGEDPRWIDEAVTVLNNASCEADVRKILRNKAYMIINRGLIGSAQTDVHIIYYNNKLLLEYRLTELQVDAQVEIL